MAGVRDRRLHLLGVGLPRSGTHSLASLFQARYRAAHEPAARSTIRLVTGYAEGRIGRREMRASLLARDRSLHLEVEASHFLHHAVDLLPEVLPEARFVLTVREPCAWLESEICQNAKVRGRPPWSALERCRYRRYGLDFTAADRALQRLGGVHPLASYLRYWCDHIEAVLRHVPPERVLILRTEAIGSSLDAIASFAGVPAGSLDALRAHAGRRREVDRLDLAEWIDPGVLDACVREHCGPLYGRLFPGARPRGFA